MKRIALISKTRCGTHFLKSMVPESSAHSTPELFWNGFIKDGFQSFWYQMVNKNKKWLLRGREEELYRKYFKRLSRRYDDRNLLCDIKIEQLKQLKKLAPIVGEAFDGFLILKRENLLKMVISQILMHERLKEEVAANNSSVPELKQLTVDPKQIVSKINSSREDIEFHEELFKTTGKPCFSLKYEELSSEPGRHVNEMLEYFGLPGSSEGVSNLKKQNPQTLEEIVVNYSELRAALETARMDHFLGMPG